MDTDVERRRKLLNYVLLGGIVSAVVALLILAVTPPMDLADTIQEAALLRNTVWAALGVSVVLWAFNRYLSVDLAAAGLILFMELAVVMADTPYHVVQGRSLLWFSLPIVAASMLLRSWTSFVAATLASALVIYIGLTSDPVMTGWFGVLGFYFLALVTWLAASTLERMLDHSQSLALALATSEERYHGIFEHALSGIGLHEVIRDQTGRPIDYCFLDVNRAFERQTGLRADDILGQAASDVLPLAATNQPFIEIYGRVVDTGVPLQFEQYSEPLDRTYAISAFPIGENQFVTIFSDISERIRRDREREALLASVSLQTEELRSVMDTVPVGVVVITEERQVVMANAIAQELLDQSSQVENHKLMALGGQPLEELLHGPAQRYWQTLPVDNRALEITTREVEHGATSGWVLVVRDVTQERDFERRLRQQDRLAMIGQLAGGIAHDFNNLLTTILGFSEFALDGVGKDSAIYEDIAEVRSAALRAADLTQQLLAFSRRQILQPKVVSLNETIQGMQRMLGGMLEETIELDFALSPDVADIKVDPVQVQQVIMNLCVNARDAMPDGGRLTIGTSNILVRAPAPVPHQRISPGRYVMLSVADTGTGMSDDVLQHMFEPFYTTKEVGKGTGLGLATVYGIIRQSEGQMSVTSTLGVGTTFRVYFCQAQDGERALGHGGQGYPSAILPHGSEVILLVEDEAAVRRLARRELEALGYTVLEADRPSVALALSRAAHEIDLLLTDVVMPEMDGAALAQKVREQRPELRVLYVSGYTDRNLDQLAGPGTKALFLEKPYNNQQLAETVRAVLNQA